MLYILHTHFQSKPKGVEGLIDVENPNRVAGKMKKVKDIDVHAKVELSRRERYSKTCRGNNNSNSD